MIISDIKGLGKYSKKIIKVECDSCSIIKELKFKLYTSYGYTDGDYLCRKCKLVKNNLLKYGVENVFQLESTKEKIKKTNLEKYGVENISQSEEIKEKRKNTSLEKHGETHHFKSSLIKEKTKKTNIDKYGVENISMLDDIKEKKEETSLKNRGVKYIFLDNDFKNRVKKDNLNKYGVEELFNSEIIKEKIKKTNIERYGFEIPSKSNKVKQKIKKSVTEKLHNNILSENKNIISIDADNRIFNIFCSDCQSEYEITYSLFYKRRETLTTICTNCNVIDKHQSGKEILLQKFIEENYKGKIVYNKRLENKEIDIYLPNLNLGLEFNGIYWHSDIFKGRNYHKEKTDICKNNNIQLVHIWEDDWDYKNNIIKSIILNKLNLTTNRIYARNCKIIEITDNEEYRNFLNENHIQGYVGASKKLGLFYNNKLVSIMAFKKSKFNEYELSRYCSLLNTNVVGGASKLFKYFINNIGNRVTTFSDNSYSNGKLYEKLGFKKVKELKPDYKYIVSNIRIHKFNFRNKDVSNINRIYDSGKVKYEFRSE